MAILAQDQSKRLDPNQNKQLGGQTPLSGGAPLTNQGGSLSSSGGNISSQPQGSGGVSRWTNIQTYLDANKNTKGSSRVLNQNVGTAFQQDQQRLKQESEGAKAQAKQEVEGNKMGTDKASQLITDIANNSPVVRADPNSGSSTGGLIDNNYYDVIRVDQGQPLENDPGNPMARSQAIQQIQDVLNAQYGGPDQFNFSYNDQVNQYGQNLGSDPGFKAVMQHLYQNQSGGRMGSGGLALQSQLDQGNEVLQDLRQDLSGQYGQMQSDLGSTLAGTNEALDQYVNQFTTDQQALEDYLLGESENLYSAIDSQRTLFNDQESLIDQGKNADAIDWSELEQYVRENYADDYDRVLGLNKESFLGNQSVFDYNPLQATMENIGGVDMERNKYNAIMEVLDLTDSMIQDQVDAQHGKARWSEDLWQDWYNNQ